MIDFLVALAQHTPSWVWTVFAVLVYMGLKQTRDRDVSAQRMVILPLAMAALSASGTWQAFSGPCAILAGAAWLVGAVLGFGANRRLDLPRRVSLNDDGSFRIGGSWAPLVLFVGIFALRYAMNVALAVAPSLATNPAAAIVGGLISGLPTGMLVSRARKVLSTRRATGGLVGA